MRALPLTLVAGSLLVAPGAAEARREPCHPPHSHTVAEGTQARIFTLPGKQGSNTDKRLLGCLFARDRSVWLAKRWFDGYVQGGAYGHVALNGRFVGFSTSFTDRSCKAACPPDYHPTTYELHVRDLRHPKKRTVNRSDARPTVVLVSHRGALVWSDAFGLHAFDNRGARVLDDGGYDGSSIRITGDTVSWTHGGKQRSAPLGRY